MNTKKYLCMDSTRPVVAVRNDLCLDISFLLHNYLNLCIFTVDYVLNTDRTSFSKYIYNESKQNTRLYIKFPKLHAPQHSMSQTCNKGLPVTNSILKYHTATCKKIGKIYNLVIHTSKAHKNVSIVKWQNTSFVAVISHVVTPSKMLH